MGKDQKTQNADFWSWVDYSGGSEACWPWTGGQSKGRGMLYQNGRSTYAYRVAFALANDVRIPNGMMICHRCDNPICCNPSHLFLGTAKDNLHDCMSKGRLPPPSNTKLYSFNGQDLPLKNIAALIGVSRAALSNRLDRGWSFERAFSSPTLCKPLTVCQSQEIASRHANGESIVSIARSLGASRRTIRKAIQKVDQIGGNSYAYCDGTQEEAPAARLVGLAIAEAPRVSRLVNQGHGGGVRHLRPHPHRLAVRKKPAEHVCPTPHRGHRKTAGVNSDPGA